MRDAARDAAAGATAGMVATVVMSGVLGVAAKGGLLKEPPPRAIVRTALPGLSVPAVNAGALVAHVGYGAAVGALHRAVLGGPGVGASVAYALAVWASAYEGWVPVLRALPPAHLDDRGRQASMIAGHLAYGVVLGVLARRSDQAARRRAAHGARHAAPVEGNGVVEPRTSRYSARIAR